MFRDTNFGILMRKVDGFYGLIGTVWIIFVSLQKQEWNYGKTIRCFYKLFL